MNEAKMNPIRVQFRMVYFPKVSQYVAMAWNYNVAIIFATLPHPTYAQARMELTKLAMEREVQLQWFDGDYVCTDGEILTPMPMPFEPSSDNVVLG